jgi:hypothetical protein
VRTNGKASAFAANDLADICDDAREHIVVILRCRLVILVQPCGRRDG